MSTRCITPFQTKDANRIQVLVPCGKCPGCVARRTSSWSFRLMQEERRSRSAFFVTFTYNPDHVPITDHGYMSLRFKDMQDFFKRLRKAAEKRLENSGIKYYCAGEYGTIGCRPHYHAIIFNAHPDDIMSAWTLNGKSIGDLHFGTVTGASVGYTLKYLAKKNLKINRHANDDRIPERALMSKGLGANYLTAATIAFHLAKLTERVCHILPGGKKAPMSRYYKQKIYNSEHKGFLAGYFEKEALNAPPSKLSPSTIVARDLGAFRKMNRSATKDRLF